MKLKATTVLVLGGTALAILVLFVVGTASLAGRGRYSADALSGDLDLDRREMKAYAMAPSPSAAPEAAMGAPSDDSFAALRGAAPGGGGRGDGIGIGSIGGRHGGDEGKMGKKDARKVAAKPMAAPKEEEKEADQSGGEGGMAAAPAATRAWFPETFLFRPLIVTDASGHATVRV
jgi:hypothetical protein